MSRPSEKLAELDVTLCSRVALMRNEKELEPNTYTPGSTSGVEHGTEKSRKVKS